jgi:PTS system sucrose-specific IIC component
MSCNRVLFTEERIMQHKQVAKDVLAALGGPKNIQAAAHCATRLRIVTIDKTAIDQQALDANPDVKGTFEAGGQFQIIIGPGDVDKVYDALISEAGITGATKDEVKQVAGQQGNWAVRFIKTLADIFVPILPALIAGGLLMALHNIIGPGGLLGKDGLPGIWPATAGIIDLVNMLAAAAFTFLPIIAAFSAAKRFGANPYLGATIGAAMVMPQLVNGYNVAATVQAGKMPFWDVFGLHVAQAGYQGSVIPVLAVVYLMSVVEKLFHKLLRGTIDFLFTPMITILITGLATFIFVGPIMRTVSDALTNGILWLYSSTGIFGGAVFGFFYSLIVVTGLHQSFPPVELALFEKGGSFIFATASMANVAQGAACLAVFLLMKKKSKLRALAGGSSFSALLGITEPAIFGVTLRMRFPFFIGMCATAVSGALISYFHVVATALGAAGLLGFVSIKTQRIPEFFLCMVVSFVLSFGATYAYGKYRLHKGLPLDPDAPLASAENDSTDSINAPEPIPGATTDFDVTSPVNGDIMALSDVHDASFAQGLLGPGVAVAPREGDVVSPVDGVVRVAFPTGHAYGLQSASGIELLIHIGLDTVTLNGKYFEPQVKAGDFVRRGDVLAHVDWEGLKSEGFDITTPIVVTNAATFADVTVPQREKPAISTNDVVLSVENKLVAESTAASEEQQQQA